MKCTIDALEGPADRHVAFRSSPERPCRLLRPALVPFNCLRRHPSILHPARIPEAESIVLAGAHLGPLDRCSVVQRQRCGGDRRDRASGACAVSRRGCQRLQGRSVRRADGGGTGSCRRQADALDRRARRARLRTDARRRATSGPHGRNAPRRRRRLPRAQRLHAGACGEPASGR